MNVNAKSSTWLGQAQGHARTDEPPLAVVVKGYPRLSETFIAQELLELQNRGYRFDIWSLRLPYDGGRTHKLHDQISARARYLPEYLHQAPLQVLRAWREVRRLPGYAHAYDVWRKDLARDFTRNRIRRWGQALVLAAQLPAETRFIYAHFLHTPASVARYAAKIRRLEWAVSAHAKDIWTIPNWEKAEKLRDARFAVTCTESGAQELARVAPDPSRIGLVYHGLDLSRFPRPPDRKRNGPFTLLSVGRLVAKKGYDDLLAALTRLPADLDWRLVHIGGGELSPDIRAEAARLKLENRIDWRGKQDQDAVIAAMRSADLFVLPSKIAADGDRDGLPNVLMEAASQHLPILSTQVSAIPEFVQDGVHGRLVPPSNPAALADAIAQMAANPTASQAMAHAARERLLADFDMHRAIGGLDMRLSAALDPV